MVVLYRNPHYSEVEIIFLFLKITSNHALSEVRVCSGQTLLILMPTICVRHKYLQTINHLTNKIITSFPGLLHGMSFK